MKATNNIWGELEDLPDEEVMHVLTKLFALYEDRLKKNTADQDGLVFFRNFPESVSRPQGCIKAYSVLLGEHNICPAHSSIA